MKHCVKGLVFVGVLVLVALTSISAQAVDYYPVTVTVNERSSGAPVKDAYIEAIGPMHYTGVTDGFGQVTFTMVANSAVAYSIRAGKNPSCGADSENVFVTGPTSVPLYLEKVTVKVVGTTGCGQGGYETPLSGVSGRCIGGSI